jgi:hypothetical protein
MSQYSLTIDGNAVTTTMTFHVLNPADETVVAACPEATTALQPWSSRMAFIWHEATDSRAIQAKWEPNFPSRSTRPATT